MYANALFILLAIRIQRVIFLSRALRKVKFYIMDAGKLATNYGLKGRINMICMVAFFRLSRVLQIEKSISLLRESIIKSYLHKGDIIVQRNLDLLNAVCSDPNFLVSIDVPSRWRRAMLTEEQKAYSYRHITLIDDKKSRKFMEDIHRPVS